MAIEVGNPIWENLYVWRALRKDGSTAVLLLLSLQKEWMTSLKEFDRNDTPPKFNIATEKWWLEDHFPIGKVTFQGLC